MRKHLYGNTGLHQEGSPKEEIKEENHVLYRMWE